MAIEAKLKRAGFVLEQLVDNRAFARTGDLEKGNLVLRLEADDFAQIIACDRGFSHDVRRAFLHDVATGAKVGWEKQPGVAGLENEAGPYLRTGERGLAFRIDRNSGS